MKLIKSNEISIRKITYKRHSSFKNLKDAQQDPNSFMIMEGDYGGSNI